MPETTELEEFVNYQDDRIEELVSTLKSDINDKDEAFDIIYRIGLDYDNCRSSQNLMKIIDEMMALAWIGKRKIE